MKAISAAGTVDFYISAASLVADWYMPIIPKSNPYSGAAMTNRL